MREFNVTVDGQTYRVSVEENESSSDASDRSTSSDSNNNQSVKSAPNAPTKTKSAGDGSEVLAPMPGTILDIKFMEGATVKEGDTIIVLEAMKMENDIVAPCDGKISSILVKKGDSVNSDDILATVL